MAQTPTSRSRSNWVFAVSSGLLVVVVILVLMNARPQHSSVTFSAPPTPSAGLSNSPATPYPYPTTESSAAPPATTSAGGSARLQVPDPCSLVPVPVFHAAAGSDVMLVSLARVTDTLTGDKTCVYDPASGAVKIQPGSQQINGYIMIQDGVVFDQNIAINFLNEAELKQLPGVPKGMWITGGDQISTGKCYELVFRMQATSGLLQATIASSGLVDRATLLKVGTPLAQALLARAGGVAV